MEYTIEELKALNEQYRMAKAAYDKAMEATMKYMVENNLEKLENPTGAGYVKLVHQKETLMPAYTRKAYDYVRLF